MVAWIEAPTDALVIAAGQYQYTREIILCKNVLQMINTSFEYKLGVFHFQDLSYLSLLCSTHWNISTCLFSFTAFIATIYSGSDTTFIEYIQIVCLTFIFSIHITYNNIYILVSFKNTFSIHSHGHSLDQFATFQLSELVSHLLIG